jgi:hypothetical protein
MSDSIQFLQQNLIKLARTWASGKHIDPAQAADLRRRAILANHRYYLEHIPVYSRLAAQQGIRPDCDVQAIKSRLMLADSVFKSYDGRWLDENDFGAMNRWLSGIYHHPVEFDTSGIETVDDWLNALSAAGIRVAFSSGTSGVLSFVPRSREDMTVARAANACCLPALVGRKQGGKSAVRWLKPLLSLISPQDMMSMVVKAGIHGFDAVFLGFTSGGTGNQLLMADLAPLFRRVYYLYDFNLSATALLAVRRGPRTEKERQMAAEFERVVVENGQQAYSKLIEHIKASAADGQKVFIFGAPFQCLELCRQLSSRGEKIKLPEGSLALFGGGWKGFDGQAVGREELVSLLADVFGLAPEAVLEGFSMTEISLLTLRCDYGRFHLPPVIEPVFMDAELNPVDNPAGEAVFAFMDPLALSCPGFIITGDLVQPVSGRCACGLEGPALTAIRRAGNQEIKGCGGVMGSIRA